MVDLADAVEYPAPHYRPSEVTVAAVEKFKTAKLAERERRLAAIEEWQKEDPKDRGRMPVRPLGKRKHQQVPQDPRAGTRRGGRARLRRHERRPRQAASPQGRQATPDVARAARGAGAHRGCREVPAADRDDDPRRASRRRTLLAPLAPRRPRGRQARRCRLEDRRRPPRRRRHADAARRAQAAPGRLRADRPGRSRVRDEPRHDPEPLEHHTADPPAGARAGERRAGESGEDADRGRDEPFTPSHLLRAHVRGPGRRPPT